MGGARPGRVGGYQADGGRWDRRGVDEHGVDAFVRHGTFTPGRGVADDGRW